MFHVERAVVLEVEVELPEAVWTMKTGARKNDGEAGVDGYD
jgi:hypothetical protein